MSAIVYIRMKRSTIVQPDSLIRLQDIAHLVLHGSDKVHMELLPLLDTTKVNDGVVIIDSLTVIEQLTSYFPMYEFELIGEQATRINVQAKQAKRNLLVVFLIWVLLFIGTAMTIINFHEDVSMQAVQQKMHYVLTGEHSEYPLKIQIPYSLGLGVGMVVFLNRLFQKKINDEPSPLEIELYKYEKELNDYITYDENELNKTNADPKYH